MTDSSNLGIFARMGKSKQLFSLHVSNIRRNFFLWLFKVPSTLVFRPTSDWLSLFHEWTFVFCFILQRNLMGFCFKTIPTHTRVSFSAVIDGNANRLLFLRLTNNKIYFKKRSYWRTIVEPLRLVYFLLFFCDVTFVYCFWHQNISTRLS